MPRGCGSLVEANSWQRHSLECIKHDIGEDRYNDILMKLNQRTLHISTACTGIGAPEHACNIIANALNKEISQNCNIFLPNAIRFAAFQCDL